MCVQADADDRRLLAARPDGGRQGEGQDTGSSFA